MNVPIDRYSIIIVALAALLAVSVGCNIRLGGSVADNNRLRQRQQELESTIAELAAERDAERAISGELRSLGTEARGIIREGLNTTEANSTNITRANEKLRKVIAALQSLELLYRGVDGSGGGGVDTVGGE